jgi:V-type H+-transporting ATPase subunit a
MSVIPSKEEPPTHFRTNKFTVAFQNIVDAYGVGHYREVNPGVFTIITFPFLFAVMFGDVGHGFLLFLFAVLLVWKEKQLAAIKLNELIDTCFGGRYVLLLMGMFSVYTGLLYNEMFSVAINLCGSNWVVPEGNSTTSFSRIDDQRAYEFGVDPAWNGAANNLLFYNSLKMKLSIILGVTQMVLGIFLSLANGIYFKHKLDVYCEFLPQIIFMLALFGYMVFLIIFKWFVYWKTSPPFLLNVMIQMFLSPLRIAPENQVFEGQLGVQLFLLIIAVVSVPWMLLSKPLIMRRRHNQKMMNYSTMHDSKPDPEHDEEEEEFDFGEIFVHQCIHTIEYVLGAISNTASYLRLWALSLAHSELSIVFWEMILLRVFSLHLPAPLNGIAAFIGWGAWAGITFGVLLVMESLSAFLHALRLHWVEFQNKFYKGDGIAFSPFSYEKILSGKDDS